MLRQVAVFAFALLSLAQQPPQPALSAEFEAAAKDDARVVPLILEVSERLPKVDGAEGQRLADALEPFLQRVFFSPQRFPGAEKLGLIEHTVAQGELPGSIAKRYKIGAGMLRYLNADYDERRIGAGRKLRVLDLSNGALQLIVDKERFRLGAWLRTPEGRFVLALYVPVGLGAPGSPTPSGATKITDRVRDPSWTDPATHVLHAPGDPLNVLGGYWIRLDSEGLGKTGIGLHGYTGAPEADWVAKGSSSGCVRMLKADIDRVFELAIEGTPVSLAP